MNRMIVVFFVLVASAVLASGQDKSQTKSAETSMKTVSIRVPTIQCGSCKMNIEKALNALEGVKSAEVDLKKKIVAVDFFVSTVDLGTIETAITKAGYAANDKKADPEAYAKLDDCCKLPQDQN